MCDDHENTLRLDRDTMKMLVEEKKDSPKPSILVVQGVDRGEQVMIEGSELTIGRNEKCDLIIRDDGISRFHARVVKESGQFVIEDLGSTNGLFLGEERVSRHVFAEGDKVLIGRCTILKFVYQDSLDVEYQEQMYDSAVKDGLTGIFNRKHFNERIQSEVSFSNRHKTPLSVILFDLDYFKKVNDTYGHLVGDMVLVKVASSIRKALREEDFFARYGGEEFVVLARNIDSQGASALGERMRQLVQDLRILTPEGPRVPVTISLGTATVEAREVVTGEELTKLADEQLYLAKENGRNRVESSSLM